MRPLLVSLTLALLASACATTAVRDAKTYEMEVKLMEEFSMQQSDLLTTWIGEKCTCDAAKKFSTPLCKKSAEMVVVAKARVPWHAQMMRLNAGLIEENPGDTPDPPSADSLCPAPGVTPPVAPVEAPEAKTE